MKKLSTRIAVMALLISTLVASPSLASGDEAARSHGPSPIAAGMVLYGAAFWVATRPIVLLSSPLNMGAGFEEMVIQPFRVMIGTAPL